MLPDGAEGGGGGGMRFGPAAPGPPLFAPAGAVSLLEASSSSCLRTPDCRTTRSGSTSATVQPSMLAPCLTPVAKAAPAERISARRSLPSRMTPIRVRFVASVPAALPTAATEATGWREGLNNGLASTSEKTLAGGGAASVEKVIAGSRTPVVLADME